MAVTPAERASDWRKKNPEREKATKIEYRASDPERWFKQKKASGQRWRDANRDSINAKAAAERILLRAAAITAYGGKCVCPGCHVHHAELLTIDHINGDAHHRQNLTNGVGRSTRDFHKFLQKNGYPPEFQLLCGSCNLAKGNKKTCPLSGQEH
jgi:5-methylcytosine-specific restriction endonuclease McrA